jgi:hypothetical protein
MLTLTAKPQVRECSCQHRREPDPDRQWQQWRFCASHRASNRDIPPRHGPRLSLANEACNFLPMGSGGTSLTHCSLVRSARPIPRASFIERAVLFSGDWARSFQPALTRCLRLVPAPDYPGQLRGSPSRDRFKSRTAAGLWPGSRTAYRQVDLHEVSRPRSCVSSTPLIAGLDPTT